MGSGNGWGLFSKIVSKVSEEWEGVGFHKRVWLLYFVFDFSLTFSSLMSTTVFTIVLSFSFFLYGVNRICRSTVGQITFPKTL